nr:uncharacterized protein LOC111502600 [Leptinotarsa decemlineata]
MKLISLIFVACALSCKFVHGVNDPREQFEIRDGYCTNAVMGDLVFQDHVHLTRIPFMTRNTTTQWHGDKNIYCILALSAKPASKGSTVFVKEGGLGHSFVTLEFHSTKNHGLEYSVQVFGN